MNASSSHTYQEAYAYGRCSVWREEPAQSLYANPALQEAYIRGRRHARAEQRLDADTEWDGEE